jgi:hypothetical protein
MAGGDCSLPGSAGGIAFSSNQSLQDEDEKLLRLLFTVKMLSDLTYLLINVARSTYLNRNSL